MTVINSIPQRLFKEQSNAPLIVFRILFGALMFFSTIRFWVNGWIEDFYITPLFHFKYYGFEWVKVLPPEGMYTLFIIAGLSALMIMLGLFYRIATILFFISFTYIELIDKTYYLNHYYFVSLIALILVFLPAHRRISLDTKIGLVQISHQCKRWHVLLIQFQLGIVYIFAGIAKIHPDWLFRAQPLQNWLHTNHHLPLIGPWLKSKTVAYLMSWGGMLYDLFIVFFLSYKKTRWWAYGAVIIFHVFTWILFPIGVFPWVMIGSTLIFFSTDFHEKLLKVFHEKQSIPKDRHKRQINPSPRIVQTLLACYMVFQVLFPFRYLLYNGNLFWKEQGYRFSWRVMLMEKAGHATFYVEDGATHGRIEIDNSQYLTPIQEKMMATQPDMILEYAQFLQREFDHKIISVGGQQHTVIYPKVYADVFVTLNGSGSKPFVKEGIELTSIPNDLSERTWITSYEK